jgi:DNA-binding XRE family transcriptional regulator
VPHAGGRAEGDLSVAEPIYGPAGSPIEVVPVVVLSQVFTARPSSIPEIRDFVRRCLAESPLTEEGTREVGETVFRALLDAAGPDGSIQVAFRIFPEHVEVDVLHSDQVIQPSVAPGPPMAYVRQATSDAAAPPERLRAVPSPGDRSAEPVGSAASAGPRSALPGTMPGSRPFADWMQDVLRTQGLTQEAAARQLGVSVKTVSRWVGGATEPRMRDLRRIQEVFGEVPLP